MYLIIIRTAIILFTNHAIGVILWNQFMERRRSLWPLCFYLFAKCAILNIGLATVIKVYHAEWYAQTRSIQFVYIFATWLFAITTFVVLKWTFDVSIEKMMLMSFLGDCLSACVGSAGMFAVNFLMGRTLGFAEEVSLPFRWADLFIPVFSMGLLFLLLHLLEPWVKRLRDYQIKHKKFVMVLVAIGIVFATWPLIKFAYDDGMNGMTTCISMGLILLLSAVWLNRQHRLLKKEQEFLSFQFQMMEKYYNGVKRKEEELQHNQALLSKQMKELSADAYEISDEQITAYLEELRREYNTLKRGLYCDDPVLDAVIVTEAEIMESGKIAFDCSLQHYRRNDTEQRMLVSLILYLLDFGIRANQKLDANRHIFLRIANVKNQLMISYQTGALSRERLSKKSIRTIMNSNESTLVVKQLGSELTVDILVET
ncbi:hypothetical protein [Hespellia stercorisuis]|uniref:Uncharacterized protein n=1 Tax=Hespellia stercorisuis DSM 15480 TaxID=1121950 RepID=A0A1M6WK11_9FIRM|nr:hypothetical protein [Hespellia stercorisuis]SHK94133.1 hypothetical protein SAMN02745243_04038 [Hespellia stercorisuis DSM 15480]